MSLFSKACTVVEYQNLVYFLKQMARCSYGNLSSSSLNMKMWNRWSKKLTCLLRLSLALFYSSSNNKLILLPSEIYGRQKCYLFFYRQKQAKTVALVCIIRHNLLHQHYTGTVWACFMIWYTILCSLEHGFILVIVLLFMTTWNYLAVIFGYVQILYLRKLPVPL